MKMAMMKKLTCLLTVLALSGSLAACGGKTTAEDNSTASEHAAVSGTAADDAAADIEDQEDEDDEEDDDAPIDVDQLVVRSSTTESGDTDSSAADSSDSSSGSSSDSSSGSSHAGNTGGSSADTASVGTASSAAASADSSAAAPDSTASAPESTPSADTPSEPDDVTSTEEENVVSGIIDLNTLSFEGEGITVSGSTVTITGEGTYVLSGNLTGMVEVNTLAKVKLKLNGVSINNPYGPAILCTDAKKLTITNVSGTVNYLSDGVNDTYDGCICSNDTLELKGSGTMELTAYNRHGISSDDDIIIKNGTITINANKTGLMANDDITISGGTLRITSNTNAIKSKGTLNISGGTIRAFGGAKEGKSALYSAGVFTLTGGYVYGFGCFATVPEASTSTQCALIVKIPTGMAAGSTAAVVSNGVQLMSESSPNAYDTVFYSAPELYDGMPFEIYTNDVAYGESFTAAGIATSVTLG